MPTEPEMEQVHAQAEPFTCWAGGESPSGGRRTRAVSQCLPNTLATYGLRDGASVRPSLWVAGGQDSSLHRHRELVIRRPGNKQVDRSHVGTWHGAELEPA